MYRYSAGFLWLGIYALLALVPLGIALLGERPPHRGFWIEFGVALGFIGLAMMALQSLFSGRYRPVAPTFGGDNVLNYHREAGVVAVLMVLLHPIILLLAEPGFREYLDPRADSLRALALISLVIAALLVIATSLWRLSFRLNYEWWRLLHGLLALFLIAGALGHALMVANYLGPLWKQVLLVMVLGLAMYFVVHTRLVRPWLARKRPYKVVEVTDERGETASLTLKPASGERLPFRSGQYVWLTIGSTPFSLQQNPFSVVSSAEAPTIAFAAKAQGDFTRSWPQIRPGDTAYLEGPFGSFTPAPDMHLFLIMGGIGITPAMSMLRTLRDRGDRRRVILLYCNPDWESLTFRDEIEQLRGVLNLQIVYVLQEPPPQLECEQGLLDEAKLLKYLPEHPETFTFFICGPKPLMDATEVNLRNLGVDWRHIYTERFHII